jgi:UDP-N-acetyl-2-amino-2-deoxyglucuronate dehydrogenase
MLAGSDADIVIIATPSGIHGHQAVQIAAAGLHVMTEKPMATR